MNPFIIAFAGILGHVCSGTLCCSCVCPAGTARTQGESSAPPAGSKTCSAEDSLRSCSASMGTDADGTSAKAHDRKETFCSLNRVSTLRVIVLSASAKSRKAVAKLKKHFH